MPVTEDLTLSSSLPQVEIPDVTYHDFVLPTIERSGDLICETEYLTGRETTFSTVRNDSFHIAAFLQKNGLGPGDRIAIHCRNILEYLPTAFGILRAGCTIVNIRGETSRELRAIIEDAKPIYVFTEDSRSTLILQATKGLTFVEAVISFGNASGCVPFKKIIDCGISDFRKPNLLPGKAVALVTYTSGTTGLPKGAQLTHRNLLSIVLLHDKLPRVKNARNHLLLHSTPVHITGAVFRLANLHKAEHTVLLPSFNPDNAMKAIERYEITDIILLTTNAWALSKVSSGTYNITTLKTALVGGGPVPCTIKDKLKKLLNLQVYLNVYGQTEALCNFIPNSSPESIGMLASNCEAKVVDTKTGKNLPAGKTGELYVKGPTVMKGYLNNVEETKNMILPGGWLRTGDLVCYDTEERFFYLDRIKDIMKCKDSQVSPSELEQVLVSHPSVAEAAVISIPHKEFGEVPRAYVVLKTPCEEDLEEYVSKLVSDHKKLRGGICFVDNLPISTTGKYLKKQLQEEYLKESPSSNIDWSRSSTTTSSSKTESLDCKREGY